MTALRIGTRQSKMAIVQTEDAARLIQAARPDVEVEVVPFSTVGDVDQVSRLARHGGKGGAFVEQIREALRSGEINAVMHSLKDMPGNEETAGLVVGAYLKRESPLDALVVRPGVALDEFRRGRGRGFKVGTNSVRRAAYVRRLFPGAEVIHYRGSANTRIDKLDSLALQRLPGGGAVGPADLLVLAASGLERIALSDRIAHVFGPDEMLPAVGQGIVALECRERDWETRAVMDLVDDRDARTCALAEREVLWILNGHCNSPIAAHASRRGDTLDLRAALISEAGDEVIEASASGPAGAPRELGRSVAFDLVARGASRIIEATREPAAR